MTIKYCLPIIKSNTEEIEKIIKDNKDSYYLFEVWLDYIEDLNLEFIEKLTASLGERIIFLFRRQGLERVKMDKKRKHQIINLLKDSSALLDLDIFNQKKEIDYIYSHKIKLNLILSYHNYKQTPHDKNLNKIIKHMKKYRPLIYKVSTFCQKEEDCLRLLNLLIKIRKKNVKFIILGMGQHGVATRIFGTVWGNEMIFAPKTLKQKSAPGQIIKEDLERILKIIC